MFIRGSKRYRVPDAQRFWRWVMDVNLVFYKLLDEWTIENLRKNLGWRSWCRIKGLRSVTSSVRADSWIDASGQITIRKRESDEGGEKTNGVPLFFLRVIVTHQQKKRLGAGAFVTLRRFQFSVELEDVEFETSIKGPSNTSRHHQLSGFF